MALLNEVEAAMRMGVSVELLRYFNKHCPKTGENRLLVATIHGDHTFYEQRELDDYRRYLNKPWPHKKGKRPEIPEAIKQDIKMEAHLWCAICGNVNSCEVAHIEAVADTLNNSPDNLIYICPNHHTDYDLGYKPSSNVTMEAIRSAKLLRRDSRLRMMRFEANASKLLHSMIATLEKLVGDAREAKSTDLASVLETETRQVLSALPDLIKQAEAAAAKDSEFSSVDKAVSRFAPTIGKYLSGLTSQSNESQVRMAAESVVDSLNATLATLDEVECPHCGGRGMVGLVGDFCNFCHGDQVVTHEQAESYDPENLDEALCPRCYGRGMTGLVGDVCAFCEGSCVVSKEQLKTYDVSSLDEVLCPHCGGRGMTGLANDLCSYCGGSCYVCRSKARAFSKEAIDEVDCPHCVGRGFQGYSSYLCSYCNGSQRVSREVAANYAPHDIDEVPCPHCDGRGLTGLNNLLCSFCEGARVVTTAEKDGYSSADFDEVECPRCAGKGMTGLRGNRCALCKGDCVVSRETANAFRQRGGYGTDR
jgi:DnaJ-class molecular chaperone